MHIVPGSGGTFYCQNCLRDITLVNALRRRGHDVMLVPMYLPLFTEAREMDGGVPVFFGGINVYLQQKIALFRWTPRWVDKLFDSNWMLRKAAAQAGSTDAAKLGPMTLSMMQGREGRQKKEVERLLAWLSERERPDIVHISNALLIGLAGEFKKALGVPVVCSLQDEDFWLDEIDPPYDRICWEAMASRADDVDAFVAVSDWYAGRMCDRMNLARDRVSIVHIGMDFEGYGRASLSLDPPVLGYLSRMSESLGLGRLVDAFIALKQEPELKDLKLRATGGLTPANEPYVRALKERLTAEGYGGDVEFLKDFSGGARKEFLRSLSVMSVPVSQGEAFGTYIIEALAAGVPVVQPSAGAFPELVEATGGGVTYDPRDDEALPTALKSLLLYPDRLRELGKQGREAVLERFSVDSMADGMLGVYTSLAG